MYDVMVRLIFSIETWSEAESASMAGKKMKEERGEKVAANVTRNTMTFFSTLVKCEYGAVEPSPSELVSWVVAFEQSARGIDTSGTETSREARAVVPVLDIEVITVDVNRANLDRMS